MQLLANKSNTSRYHDEDHMLKLNVLSSWIAVFLHATISASLVFIIFYIMGKSRSCPVLGQERVSLHFHHGMPRILSAVKNNTESVTL